MQDLTPTGSLFAVLMLDGAARLWRENTRRAQVRG
jgi:hypothetical protein